MTTTLVPNGGFETAGSAPGSALGWSVTQDYTFEGWAGFVAGTWDVAWEGFELGWNNDDYQSEFEPPDVEAVIFNDGAAVAEQEVEDFEGAWLDNQNWGDELASIGYADFDNGTPEPFEDYEEEWDSNEDWRRYFAKPAAYIKAAVAGWYRVEILGEEFAWESPGVIPTTIIALALADVINDGSLPVHAAGFGARVVLTPTPIALDIGLSVEGPAEDTISIAAASTDEDLTLAIFNTTTDDAEDFEREWRDNENFEWSMASALAAIFDDGTPEPYEDFEEEWPTEVMQTIV